MSEYDYVIYRGKGMKYYEGMKVVSVFIHHPKKVAICDTFKNAVIKLAKLKVGEYAIKKEARMRSRK